MGLVIAVNQALRVRVPSSMKSYGEMIVRGTELIEKESQIEDSPDFVLFLAAKCMSVGYMATNQEDKAIEILTKYISLIPEGMEYNMIKVNLLIFRGYCYDCIGEYENEINDLQEAVTLARKTLNENGRQLARAYNQLGVGYANTENWENTIIYCEKAIPGYRGGLAVDKGIVYCNVGRAYYILDQYEKAKEYLLKAYINQQIVIDRLGAVQSQEYGCDIKNVKSRLREIYQSENDSSISFDQWLDKESEQYEEEEKGY